MPDPILPDFFRAQVVLKGKTGLPEDVYVNNFIFRNDTGFADQEQIAGMIADRLHEFYNEPIAATGSAVKQFISGHMVENVYDVKVYDLGQPVPRLPIIETRDFVSGLTATTTSPETAVCLSFYAGRSLPRRRGRIFLGPLGTTSLDTSVPGIVQVSTSLIATLAGAGERLASDPVGSVLWHMLSGVDANAFQVTGGWVDNALDTQRRRGNAATGRTVWGAPPVA